MAELSWRAVVRRWGPPTALALALALHFSPRQHQQLVNGSGRNPDAVGERNRQAASRARLTSLYWALKSRTLRNMLLSSALVTYAAKRLFGFRTRRSFPAFLLTIWALIYKWRVVESPKIFFRRTYWNTHIVEKARLARTEFWPVFWLFNRHAQTVTCYALSALEWLWARPIHFERETIPCHDEPNVQFIDWALCRSEVDTSLPGHGSESRAGPDRSAGHWETPIILCIHGLGDHRDIPYLKRFARNCIRNGWRVAVWSWWKFDLADSRDLKLVVDHIHQRFPRAPLVGVAWSAGVYSLVQYLEKAGSDTPLVCAVCQSGCLDFVQAVTDVTTNENKTYPLFLLGQAHVCIRRHVRNDQRIVDKTPFDRLMLEELDPMRLFNRFYSMLPDPVPDTTGGYARDGFVTKEGTFMERVKHAAHYTAPTIDHMDKIKVTTLMLHSEDDPIVASEHVNWGKIENNRHIIVAHTHRGGHCAWHEGIVPFGDTWGDRMACNFISTVLESHSQTHFIVELVRQAMSSAQFYARPSAGGGADAESGAASGANKDGSGFTPQTMARICSASDLASITSPPLAVESRDRVKLVPGGGGVHCVWCECPAANDGKCVHGSALLHIVRDLERPAGFGAESSPTAAACRWNRPGSRPSVWARNKPLATMPVREVHGPNGEPQERACHRTDKGRAEWNPWPEGTLDAVARSIRDGDPAERRKALEPLAQLVRCLERTTGHQSAAAQLYDPDLPVHRENGWAMWQKAAEEYLEEFEAYQEKMAKEREELDGSSRSSESNFA